MEKVWRVYTRYFRSTLETILRKYESLDNIKILRCYSNEPCEYFPNHTDVQKTYVSWWKYRRENMEGIDVESLIKDLKIREVVLCPPNSHHHVIIIKDIACRFPLKNIYHISKKLVKLSLNIVNFY